MAAVSLSPADMADVVRAARCALPVMFVSQAYPDIPGIRGTCTALRFRTECVFVTAAHVVEGNDAETAIYVPLGFSASEVRAQVGRVRRPRAAAPDTPVDLAVMDPATPPAFVDGESAACDVPPFARMDRVPSKAAFAIAGYPLPSADRNCVDYDAHTVLVGLQVALGTYDGPSGMKGFHRLNLSTTDTGGPNGFSGGPAFRLLHDRAMGCVPAFAGIVTNGGPECVHFIDAAYVVAFLGVAAPQP